MLPGAKVARRLCPRLGFNTADTELVAWLIEQHLTMSTVAQSRDLTDRKTIVTGFDRGLPDGSSLDADDNLWNCRVVGGAAVAKFSEDGELLDLVELPVTWPTSCTFGGDDLSTLYVTSARFTMTPDHLAANPLEGSLVAVETNVRGSREPRFG